MLKKIFSFLLFFFIPTTISFSSEKNKFNSSPISESQLFAFFAPQLQLAAKALLKVPECKELITLVNQEGSIGLEWQLLGTQNSDAAWYGDRRAIAVNASKKPTEGQKICSILFELHNALNNKRFMALDRLAIEGKINKEAYVESIERLEHENALSTTRLIQIGINRGIFPPDTKWSIIHDFNDHYKVQQLMGHSSHISQAFNLLNSQGKNQIYRGTIAHLKHISEQEKKKMLGFIALKDNLEWGSSSEREHARRILHHTYQEIWFKPYSHLQHENIQMLVLNEVFNGNPSFEKMKKKSFEK